MATRDTAWEPGTPCWVDLGADDVDKAITFYQELLGWEVQRGGEETGGYAMCLVGGRPVAGIGPRQEQAPVAWTTYLATENADDTAAKITAAGGTVLAAPFDVMEFGRMAIAADPGGAVFGLWQAKQHTGFGRSGEPGSVVWNENFSRDFDGNKKFYAAVFGFDYGDMSNEQMQYATLDLNGRQVGGIGGMGTFFPAEVPAFWGSYFQVNDTDAAVAKVEKLGGKTVSPAMDSPYGRMASVTDNQGAFFSVMAPNPS